MFSETTRGYSLLAQLPRDREGDHGLAADCGETDGRETCGLQADCGKPQSKHQEQ